MNDLLGCCSNIDYLQPIARRLPPKTSCPTNCIRHVTNKMMVESLTKRKRHCPNLIEINVAFLVGLTGTRLYCGHLVLPVYVYVLVRVRKHIDIWLYRLPFPTLVLPWPRFLSLFLLSCTTSTKILSICGSRFTRLNQSKLFIIQNLPASLF